MWKYVFFSVCLKWLSSRQCFAFAICFCFDARLESQRSVSRFFFENIKIDRSFLFRRVSCQYWTHFFGNFTYNWNLNELAPPFSRFDSSESFCQVASKYLLTKMKSFSHFLKFAQLERHFLHINGGPILIILVNSEPPECVLLVHYQFFVKLFRSILAPKVVLAQNVKQCAIFVSKCLRSSWGKCCEYLGETSPTFVSKSLRKWWQKRYQHLGEISPIWVPK